MFIKNHILWWNKHAQKIVYLFLCVYSLNGSDVGLYWRPEYGEPYY